MAELLFLLFALLALESPSISIGFILVAAGVNAWRQYKFRKELEELRQDWIAQNDALHRDLIDLRRQIVASSSRVSEKEQTSTHAEQPSRAAGERARSEKTDTVVVTPSPQIPLKAPQAPAHIPTIATQSTQATPKSEGDSTSAPAPIIPPATPAPPGPAVPPISISTSSAPPTKPPVAPPPNKPSLDAAPAPRPHPPTTHTPPLSTQRAVDSAPLSSGPAVTAPVSHPVAGQPPRPPLRQGWMSVSGLEETLGTNWLNKLGIIILVLGIALFGIYELGELGPAGKVLLSCLASVALLVGGIYLERKNLYRVLGRAEIGGGWALLFFTAYAVNHVAAMHVLDSAISDSILMLLVASAMTAHTLRYNSQVVTGLAFLLGYSTVALSHDNVYSLTAGAVLALGLVVIVIRKEWYELEFFGILSSYINHLYWLYRLLGPDGAQGKAFPEYRASVAMLLFYWVTFRSSYVIRKVKSPSAEHISTAAALANTILLLFTMKFQSVQPQLAYIALFVIGALEFTCGQLPIVKRRREAFIVLTVLGSALMAVAVPSHYSGNSVVILWMVGADVLLAVGCAMSEVVFRRLGLLAGWFAGAHLIGIEFLKLIDLRRAGDALQLAPGMVFAVSAVVFYFNSLWIGRKWAQFFDAVPDQPLIVGHSYLGAFAAAASIWALCSEDWTAVGFSIVMLTVAALSRRLKSRHLQLQYGTIGLLTLYRIFAVNLHISTPAHTHVALRLLTLPLLAGAFYTTAWVAQVKDDADQRAFRSFFAMAGTALLTALIYFEVPTLWQPLAVIVLAALLTEASILFHYRVLAWHTHALTALAVAACWNAGQSEVALWNGIHSYAVAALPVVMGAYWLAKRIGSADNNAVQSGAIAYSWGASGLMLWVLYSALQAPWVAVGWIVFAVLLVIAGRLVPFKHLGWQGSVAAFSAFGITFLNNLPLQQEWAGGISVRLVTVTLVAAGLYGISRKASAPESDVHGVSALLHTCAATTLLALLAWYEAPHAWLAPLWILFALALAVLDRRFDLNDLGWQAHALAALAVVRGVSVNLYLVEKWHGFSVRLLSLAIVASVLYALSRIVRMPEDWSSRDLRHIYSWVASTIVSLLLWYELQPLSISLGWAIFGLVLFEYGLLRAISQFRYQAYVAFAAAFGRIFFANLAVESGNAFWGPRVYSTLPLALIFFFVYTQLTGLEKSTENDRRLRVDILLASLGTGTIVALLYFQMPLDWVVTSWAGVVFLLLGVARVTGRRIFLHQGSLLAVAVLVRGIVHNLFGASYFTGSDWTGRYFVLGAAVVLLFATLPFAFSLRDRKPIGELSWKSVLLAIPSRPEQLLFFSATILLTLMLALKMRAGMVTVAWGLEGVLIVCLALALGERSFRLTGLVLLLGCVAKIILRDAWGLAPRDRYVTFIILGAALVLVSFLYTKYRDAIRQFL